MRMIVHEFMLVRMFTPYAIYDKFMHIREFCCLP